MESAVNILSVPDCEIICETGSRRKDSSYTLVPDELWDSPTPGLPVNWSIIGIDIQQNEQGKMFAEQALDLLTNEAKVDGYKHPFEDLVLSTSYEHHDKIAGWLEQIWINNSYRSALAADMLKCLASVSLEILRPTIQMMVVKLIRSPNIEERDAAVSAVELTEDVELASLLKVMDTLTPDWLEEYRNKVCSYILDE